MKLFYTPDINSNIYTLNEIESRHCIKVLRLKINDKIYLTDGKGNLFTTQIIDDNQKKCTVKIIETQKNYNKRNYYLHIAIAPTKNIERFEWFLEKATEIGIDEITPLLTENSERKTIKPERLNKKITSAVKQSLKAYHPKLNELTKFNDFLKTNTNPQKYIAHCYSDKLPHLKKIYKKNQKTTILIGPEGDFSLNEIKLASEHGFTEITLGKSRLRTETAGIVACNLINFLNL